LWQHTLAPSFASPIAQEGRHGVTLFFVISGFLIITLLLRSKESPAGFTLWKFWGRRTLRILPIYYTILLVYIILVHYTDHSPSAAAFFGNFPFFATFTTNWFVQETDHTIFFFSWSLAAEEQFYLFWPLVEVLISRPLLKYILLAAVAVASRIAAAHATFGGIDSLPVRILADIPLGIALGTGLAHLLNNETGFRIAYRVLGRHGSAFGCLTLAAIAAVISPEIGGAGEIMVPCALLLLVASTVIREDNDLAGLLRWQPIVWIGTVSYGMYMMHMLAVNAVEKAASRLHIGSPAILFLCTVATAIAMASVSFLFYERQFLVIKDRFFRD
jgi:peptidoglycan/LPS O-acetylase OafA/YrhL